MSSTTQESMVDQAKSGIGDAASTVQEKAGELKEQGRGKLGQALDERTSDAGGQARQAAQAMRQTSTQMRQPGQAGSEQLAGLFEAAADRVERLGGYLERTSGDRMLHDAEDFARRRPWAVAGMGLVVGLAASRFLKASSERRYDAGPRGSARRWSYSTGEVGGYPYDAPTRVDYEPGVAPYGSPSPSYGTPGQGGSVAGVT